MPTPPSTSGISEVNSGNTERPVAPRPPWRMRTAALFSSAVAVVLGIAPHALHHAAPIAGTALLAGAGGTLLFGLIGLIASVPLLLRTRRRSGGWSAPSGLLALFVAGFALSTFFIGPAIRGDEQSPGVDSTPGSSDEHTTHHQ